MTGNGRDPEAPVGRVRSEIGRWLPIGLLAVVLGGFLIGVTALTHRAEREQARRAAPAELDSISVLKVWLIRDWRDERILGARAITRSRPSAWGLPPAIPTVPPMAI